MTTIRIKQVDAFTKKAFGGNAAAVVLDADHLSSTEMQTIAREMNLSETVYVVKPSEGNDEADLRIRWFTPTYEVSLCGHATIAAFHVLAEEGRFGLEVNEPQSFIVETKSGNLVVDVEWKEFHPYIRFSLPIPQFFPFPDDTSLLCGAIGLSEIELSRKVNPQITDKGYCFIPVSNYESLESLEPNQQLMKKLYDRHEIGGFIVLSTDTKEKNVDWEIRFFAPAWGVLEDPVTGSAQGPVAAYLWYNALLDPDKEAFTFKGAQGSFMNRLGHVDVALSVKNEEMQELIIAGHAVTVMEGNLMIEDPAAAKL